jgi:hypothetical protein
MESHTISLDLNSALISTLNDNSFTIQSWRPNPQAVIVCTLGTKGIDFTIQAPVRGEGFRRTLVSPKSAPELHRFFSRLLMRVETQSPTEVVLAALQEAGALLPPQKIPEPVQFIARLEDEESRAAARDMRVRRPRDARTRAPTPFERCTALPGHHLTWLHDSARDIDWPYWLTAKQLLGFEEGAQEGKCRDLAGQWNSWLADARQQIARDGYAVVHDLIPALFLRSIQDYYRRLVANGYLRLGDGQSLRYSMHNEPFARWLHHHTESFVTRAIPEPAKCSYSYLGFYVAGAVLERHTDRKQCEYTLSLTVDAAPSQAREDAWPLFADLADGSRVEAMLAPGDGLIFKGRELPHYRHMLPKGRTSSSIFFHYVPTDFVGQLG